jgi:hypothetical protein
MRNNFVHLIQQKLFKIAYSIGRKTRNASNTCDVQAIKLKHLTNIFTQSFRLVLFLIILLMLYLLYMLYLML